MSRAVSIHIGVDTPRGRMSRYPLRQSERLAWQMACLAEQAGYASPLVLRGPAATRNAVHDALTAAAGSMTRGDILLVSFAGHGCLQADDDGDERNGWDETWCLYDGEIVDDQLAGYWRRFAPGVRIVVVTDGCYTGDSVRDDKKVAHPGYSVRRAPRRMRGGDYAGSCIGAPPHDTDGIQASVLLLASAREDQKAREGLFTRHLLDEWKEGAFAGTFCDLYWLVRERVMTERPCQEPQILMLGSPDPGFPLEPAFHLERRSTHGPLSIGDRSRKHAMSRAVSIHIGVDTPRGRMSGYPLRQSERLAGRMAGLAKQAGYESPLVLQGAAATRRAVHDALTAAARSMTRGDTLLVSFAGHGCLRADDDRDERHGRDATWCLYDEEIVDDQLAGYWRRFAPGVRIVVVTDGCHTGGSAREDREGAHPGYPARRAPRRMRGEDYAGSCIGASPHDTDGIQASVLLLASATEHQKAQEGLFTCHLLDVWAEGAFAGTFCDLYRLVRERVVAERGSRQEPQILMLGSPDPGFPLEPAFHLERRSTHGPLSIGDLADAPSRVRSRGLRTD